MCMAVHAGSSVGASPALRLEQRGGPVQVCTCACECTTHRVVCGIARIAGTLAGGQVPCAVAIAARRGRDGAV